MFSVNKTNYSKSEIKNREKVVDSMHSIAKSDHIHATRVKASRDLQFIRMRDVIYSLR